MGNNYCYCFRDKSDPPYQQEFLNQGSIQPVYNTTDVYVQEPLPNTRKQASKKRNTLSDYSSKDVNGFSTTQEPYTEDISKQESTSTIKKNNLPIKEKNNGNSSDTVEEPGQQDERTTDIQTLTVEELNIIENLDKILNEASTFIPKIEQFTELENSNQHYYIDESLSRLVERLDNMHEDIRGNGLLIEKRKAVYKFIFSLFDRFDEKVKINKELVNT